MSVGRYVEYLMRFWLVWGLEHIWRRVLLSASASEHLTISGSPEYFADMVMRNDEGWRLTLSLKRVKARGGGAWMKRNDIHLAT